MVRAATSMSPVTSAGFAPREASFNASVLRDEALRNHIPVPGGEGVKQPYNLNSASLQSVTAMLASWGTWDASRMLPVPQAGQPMLRIAAYEYHSGRAMEGWIDALPKDKKLKLNVVTCVSGHAGNPFETFARENKYRLAVRGPDGQVLAKQSFGPGYSNGSVKEYASQSPTVEIDVSKPGDYVIECAPDGSAGIGGYMEARRLILHITGKEPGMAAAPAGR